jgi:hypothetical protein
MEIRRLFLEGGKTVRYLLLGLFACVGIALYFSSPRNHVEVQLREAKGSPDGKWVAVVQLENYNTAWIVNDAVYAVRLKRAMHRCGEGDLVMNVPVNYPEPEPSIEWRNSTLLVTLAKHQNYQYLATSVNGIAIVVRRN